MILALYFLIAIWSNHSGWNTSRTALAAPLDALLNIYTLNWEYRWITDSSVSFKTFLDGLIFYPAPYTIALTENSFGLQLLFFPIRYLTGDALFAYNLTVFFSFPIAAFTQFLFVRWLTGSTTGAFLGGWIWGFSPMRYAQIGHFHLLPVWWFSIASLSLFKFFEAPSLLWLLVCNFALVFQYMSSISLGVFLACTLAVITSCFAKHQWQHLKGFYLQYRVAIWSLLLVNIFFGICFFWPYYQASRLWPLARSLNENIVYSAELQNYLSATTYHPIYGPLTQIFSAKDAPWEKWLFVGVTPLLLVLLTFSLRMNSAFSSHSRYLCFKSLAWVAIVGFVLSLGPQLVVSQHNTHIPLPYTLAYYLLPGFKSLRVPSRFSILFLFGLSAWCSLTICRSQQLLRKPFHRWCFVAALTGLLLIDAHHQIPTVPQPAKASFQQLVSFLNQEPTQGPIAIIPIRVKSATNFDEFVQALSKEAEREYILSETRRRMINGYSRSSLPQYDLLAESYAHKPLSGFFRDILKLGVSEVIIEVPSLTETECSQLRALLAQGQIRWVATLNAYQVVELLPE